MMARTAVASSISVQNAAGTPSTLATTAGFTGFAQFGLQDNTDWVSNTYKTIYSHTGGGVIYALVGPTAGGAETTTFEITTDGVLRTITITNANNERAMLLAGDVSDSSTDFTSINNADAPVGALDSATLTTFQTGAGTVTPIRAFFYRAIPALQYDTSCLIRMKHSASITNSVATSYSAVVVRKRIAS